MKVVLLLVAIYALIINQALKQVDSKQIRQQVRKDKKADQSTHYINAALTPVAPFEIDAEPDPAYIDARHLLQPVYLLQRDISNPEIYKKVNALYPVSYPHPIIPEKKRS